MADTSFKQFVFDEMNNHSLRFPAGSTTRRARILVLAAALISLLAINGCRQESSYTRVPSAAEKEDLLEWNTRTLLQSYEKAGYSSPKWDTPAKRALTEFARDRARLTEAGSPHGPLINMYCEDAIAAGCTDPMIAYLHARYVESSRIDAAARAKLLSAAADALANSQYPAIRKFYASLRAANAIRGSYEGNTVTPELRRFRRQLGPQLAEALADKDLPPRELYAACSAMFITLSINSGDFREAYNHIEPMLEKRQNQSVVWLLKGEAQIEMAWDARGRGYADTVTEEKWSQFRDHLQAAEQALTRAWELNPKDVRIPVQMLSVELGRGKGRESMELWFDRAMAIDPNSFVACNAKLLYLEPKWHGSPQEMLAFGRECATSSAWGGRVPLILLEAHIAARRYLDRADQGRYWIQPGVWTDLNMAFEKYFRINPGATNMFGNYAWYAFNCGQWEKFIELAPKLTAADYPTFGGKEPLDDMVTFAKLQSQGQK